MDDNKKLTEKSRARRKVMARVTLLIVAIAVLALLYWFIVLRHHQETDDAYVGGNIVSITSQVGGTVTTIVADETDRVNAGQLLVGLDQSDAKLAFDRARAQLAQAVRQTATIVTNGKQLAANVEARKAELAKAQGDLSRREAAAKDGGIGQEELQHARDAVTLASAALTASQEQLNANRELVLSDTAAKHPAVAQAAASVRESWLALKRTEVIAPVNGQLAKRSVQLGARIQPGTPLMTVVPLDHLWVDANFKESQLADLRIGQPVELIADLYGGAVKYRGKVVGLAAGTGGVFSLLPAQNATGNWIKVVQRVPVRIALDPQQVAEHPLRLGLSMDVKVDTADQSGPILAKSARTTPALQSDVYQAQLKDADKVVADIIAANQRDAR
ncbi:HlyD family efflux transporter periplasmic adaptor subunit [Neisseriaceae bacterium JH1-16]|nr:HlyD family efflux transporter periplasmic adaptor subunit [Neisseriaceae bacterium JH1-16]